MKHKIKKQVVGIALFTVGAAILSFSFNACKKDKDPEEEHVHKKATATIQQAYKDTVISGTATFTQINDGEVTLTLDLTVPSRANKSIAVHLHEMPNCADSGKMAMGHWNPTGASHGKWGSSSFHIGDIGNIPVDSKGHAGYTLTTGLWNINGSDASRNIVGRSIIVHSGVDDYTGASGNSGNRIGCSAIQ